MIIRQRQHWLRMLFIWRGSVLPRILPQLAAVTGLATLITIIHGQVFALKSPFNLCAVYLNWRSVGGVFRF